jgi:hypothetical protein
LHTPQYAVRREVTALLFSKPPLVSPGDLPPVYVP